MAITISQSTKHFSTFSAALNKAIRKQHANKNIILFYRDHIVIARLEKDFGLDVLIRSSFIHHLDKKDLNNVKYLTFLDSF